MGKGIALFFLVFFHLTVQGQGTISGRVVDLLSGHGVEGAEISIKGTDTVVFADILGDFRISPGHDSLPEGDIKIRGNIVYWNNAYSGVLRVYNISGQLTHQFNMNAGEGQSALDNLRDGLYIVKASLANGKSYEAKFLYNRRYQNISVILGMAVPDDLIKSKRAGSDTLVIRKNGYYTQEYQVDQSYAEYQLMKTSYPASTDYLSKLIRPESFRLLEGPPLNPVFSEIRSVKVVYSFKDDKIYFTNSEKYFIHYEFARDILNYTKGHAMFNQEQYTNNPNRKYILATLNLFTASGIYTLDFFSGDELTCDQIEMVYNKVAQSTYIGNDLKFYANNMKWAGCNSVPTITSNELYAGQNYQPLNPAEAYGYLKKFTLEDLKTEYAGRHDIVLLNGIPNDIAVVAGIITTEFQTPLSHINVLSHNRGAPNMALRDGWSNPLMESLSNKLVYLKVTLDTFFIREATLAEATNFWKTKEPAQVTRLEHDTITRGLIELEQAGIQSGILIGGKAANFAELMKVIVKGPSGLPLPEGAFAIPFYYYWQHMHNNELDVYLKQILAEPRFRTDFQYRRSQLERLQDSILSFPVDPELLVLVQSKINEITSFTNIRFRSSTNSEDVPGFNGAGLYDSYTGIPGDPEKTIERAIKKVWASLWNLPAFEERDYFKIDHLSVAMAILVHRSFPDEAANGVVITENLYNPYNPGIIINVQVGEISITNPEGGYVPDQIIRYTFDEINEYINHSNVPGMEGKTVLSDSEINELTKYCVAIHNHYCRLNYECLPMDIEFKVDLINGSRKIYIKQARLY